MNKTTQIRGEPHDNLSHRPLAVGCKKCPAFKLCPLTYVLGDQQEFDDEIESTNNDWVKRTYPTKADEHLDKMDDLEEKMRLTKDERFARIKESAEKKSFDERLRNRGR